MNRVPPETLARAVSGLNLQTGTFADELAAGPESLTMVLFLRHYGCMFNREMIRDIRWAMSSNASYPSPLFVGLGDHEETAEFMQPLWPEARVICDTDRTLFTAFDLGHGSVMQMFGPSVWACHVRATFRGNFFGKFVGDPWMMPGLFVVDRSNAIRYTHTFRHQGDHPDWSKIPDQLARQHAEPLTQSALAM